MVKGLLNLLSRWRWVNANESSVWPLPGFMSSKNDDSRKPTVHIDVMLCTHQDPQSSNCCRLLLTLALDFTKGAPDARQYRPSVHRLG